MPNDRAHAPTNMQSLATGISYFDLLAHGRQRVIAGVVLHGAGGVALLDPGPTSTLPTLRRELEQAGISLADVNALVLTHVHLDHAGAAGTLVREYPNLRVYVHERGAPHLADPTKLVASATRLYGDAMEKLWGEILPVPASAITTITGGERIEAGGRVLDVAYTPGHASHHVSYFSADSGLAFVGDVAGVKLVPKGFVVPPTPPPDIDLEAWRDSLKIIERWSPDTLLLTHFGPASPLGPHLSELRDHIELVGGLAKASLAIEGEDSVREAWFIDRLRQELRRKLPESEASGYEVAGRFDLNWRGLARYWRKRGA